MGLGGRWILGCQFGIVLDWKDQGGRAFIHRYGETFGQQVVRECRPYVIGEAGDEPAQLYAVNTPRETLCNTNAHIGPF